MKNKQLSKVVKWAVVFTLSLGLGLLLVAQGMDMGSIFLVGVWVAVAAVTVGGAK